MVPPICFNFLFLILVPTITATTCQNHPAYTDSLKPVLISQWEFSNPSPTAEQPVYLPRYTGHAYAPVTFRKSNRYVGLDLFYPITARHKSSKMSFQRPARVYLFVSFKRQRFRPKKTFSLSGWSSVGWAVLTRGENNITYGVHQNLTQDMPTFAYVFRKRVKMDVVLPGTKDVRRKTGSNAYIVWIGEADGTPSPSVGKFKGQQINPNARCPDILHDEWVTKDPNIDDADTRQKLFRTWHPAWDPCWWCAYDHDHGANPRVLNYTAMYDYTAFKNDRQDEADPGFKGFIFSFDQFWVYINLHVQSSSLRRVSARFHTMNIVVVEKTMGEIMMDIRFKADFGFVAVQTKRRKLQPLNHENRNIRNTEKRTLFRTINVLDLDNPNRDLLLKNRDLKRGVYEEWQTIPMCADFVKPDRGVQFTLKTPGTGVLALDKPDALVPLGRTFRGEFFNSLNLYRTVKFRRVTLGSKYCPEKKSGVFYTDPSGTTILEGPGPNAVRQYVKPDFSLHLTGKHEVFDAWNGIYARNERGFFRDHGFGLDPNVN